jgi:hypothetical protein
MFEVNWKVVDRIYFKNYTIVFLTAAKQFEKNALFEEQKVFCFLFAFFYKIVIKLMLNASILLRKYIEFRIIEFLDVFYSNVFEKNQFLFFTTIALILEIDHLTFK